MKAWFGLILVSSLAVVGCASSEETTGAVQGHGVDASTDGTAGGGGSGGGAGGQGQSGGGAVAGQGGSAGLAGQGGAAGSQGGQGGTSQGGAAGTAGTSQGGSAGSAGQAGAAGQGGQAGAGGSSGDFGKECNDNSECASGVCIEGPNGTKVCTIQCTQSCPNDEWRCANIKGVSDDNGYCVPRFTRLCRPCDSNSDCRLPNVPSESGECLSSGAEGSFCGATCSTTDPCPTGYTCDTIDMGGGHVVKQCVPDGGKLCECDPSWAGKGYDTTCYSENGFGRCMGKRDCDSGTLSPCTAKTPAKETCNGVDDDCNGAVDDGSLCNDSLPCTTDVCGSNGCEYQIQWNACVIDFKCYSKDNKNPANQCQICDPSKDDKAWSNAPAGTSCNDGSSCTEDDVCNANGTCAGTWIQDDNDKAASNDVYSNATWIGNATDCDEDSDSGTGILSGPQDVDWYKGHMTDKWKCSVDPKLSVSSGGTTVRACFFLPKEHSISCKSGSSSSAGPNEMVGCCMTGIDPAFEVKFGSAGSSDSTDFWVRIDKPSGALCPGYSFKMKF